MGWNSFGLGDSDELDFPAVPLLRFEKSRESSSNEVTKKL
jgi:hypothetical protein